MHTTSIMRIQYRTIRTSSGLCGAPPARPPARPRLLYQYCTSTVLDAARVRYEYTARLYMSIRWLLCSSHLPPMMTIDDALTMLSSANSMTPNIYAAGQASTLNRRASMLLALLATI